MSVNNNSGLKIKILVLISFILFAACVSTSSKHKDFVIADSKSYEASLFRQNCAVCHGAEANGKETDGTLVPSLRYGEAAKLSEEEIYIQIHDGKLPMPGFKNQLTDEEIRRMVKFVMRDLQQRDAEKVDR